MNDLTIAIIAGGKSSRMGTDKSFVPLLGKRMIDHVYQWIADLGQDETILITNKPEAYADLRLPMFSDVLPDTGSLGGIYTAVHMSQSGYTLCVACDMPFLNRALLLYMIDLTKQGGETPDDVIVPRVEGYPEGLHAIYSKACLIPIRKRLDVGQLKIIGFYDAVRVRYLDEAEWRSLDPQGLSFQNINTPEELQAAQKNVKNSG
jgi:molybdenum cofactor guanylyltransferase